LFEVLKTSIDVFAMNWIDINTDCFIDDQF